MEATEWVSDSVVGAKRGVFGLRGTGGIRVTNAVYSSTGSVTHAHSYLLPVLSSIHTANQPPRLTAQQLLLITGSSFLTAQVSLNPKPKPET